MVSIFEPHLRMHPTSLRLQTRPQKQSSQGWWAVVMLGSKLDGSVAWSRTRGDQQRPVIEGHNLHSSYSVPDLASVFAVHTHSFATFKVPRPSMFHGTAHSTPCTYPVLPLPYSTRTLQAGIGTFAGPQRRHRRLIDAKRCHVPRADDPLN